MHCLYVCDVVQMRGKKERRMLACMIIIISESVQFYFHCLKILSFNACLMSLSFVRVWFVGALFFSISLHLFAVADDQL